MAFRNRSCIVFQPSSLPGKLQLHSAKTCWWFAAWCFFAHQIGKNSPPTSTHRWPKLYPHDFQTLPTQVISRFLKSSYFSRDTSWNIPDIPQGNLLHTLPKKPWRPRGSSGNSSVSVTTLWSNLYCFSFHISISTWKNQLINEVFP